MLSPCITPPTNGRVYVAYYKSNQAVLIYPFNREMQLDCPSVINQDLYHQRMVDLSNDLTRSENSSYVGKAWSYCKWSSVLMVRISSGQPTPSVDPNEYFTLSALIM